MDKYLGYAQHLNANEFVQTWVKTHLAKHIEKSEVKPTTEEVEHIIDYLAQTDKKISQMSYKEAHANAEKWTKTLQKKGEHIKETAKDVEVILDFKDGFKIVKLVGENAFKREGFLMCHCAGSYHGKNTEVYSLRDKDNMPHATMEKNQQIKGKGNGDISPRYVHYVVKFLEFTGMTVGDSEMKHLGYVNVEQVLKDEPDVKFPELYNGKYFYKENLSKVENKDRFSLWGIFGLLSFDLNIKANIHFDIQKTILNFTEKLSKIKSKKIKGSGNEVAMTYGNKVAMTYGNKVAMTYGNKVAMTDCNEVAMTDCNEVAMTDCNEVAMTDCNKVAMTYGNKVAMTDGNKVAMTYDNEVAMAYGNKVAMTYGNKVAMTYGNKVAMTDGNKVAMTDGNKVAMTYGNKVKAEKFCTIAGGNENSIETHLGSIAVTGNKSTVKGKIGSWFVLYERNEQGEILFAVTFKIDGKEYKEDTFYHMVNGVVVEKK
jgi:hypothetical protein